VIFEEEEDEEDEGYLFVGQGTPKSFQHAFIYCLTLSNKSLTTILQMKKTRRMSNSKILMMTLL
jgi:hypothetical protein